MRDCIIDTNVLLVASAQHPGSPFKDSDVPADQQRVVLEWLMDFRRDGQCHLVLDELWRIWEEYNHKLTAQDIGLLVVTEKLQATLVRFVDVAYDKHGHGRLPVELEAIVKDLADRKFVAVALGDLLHGNETAIINAVDGDWHDWEKALKSCGILVTHLIEGKSRRRAKHRPKR